MLPFLACVLFAPGQAQAQGQDPPRRSAADTDTAKRGLILATDAASAGYTLFAPLNSTTTYLVDLQGKLVHSWPSKHTPGQAVYLLEDGSLLRCAREPRIRHFGGGGVGGRVERITPGGKLAWEFVYADEKHCQHHDIEPLPNGHVLLIAWEKKTREEVIAAGRDPNEAMVTELWPDCIIEVEPEGASGGKIVWEWHLWDHLVQSVDAHKPNYGVVAEHPELVDVNYRQRAPRETPAELQRLRSLGYVGDAEPEEAEGPAGGPPGRGPGGGDMQADWCHTNAVAYNAKLDQIALSVHNFNEIWIIDHSTSPKEAAGHTGGRYGKGGDLLYRWGNPRAYGAGDAKDQILFAQHDVRWIPEGSPGGGHMMVFNNGTDRPDGAYSSVVEFAPPIDSAGQYRREQGKAFGPPKPTWEYAAPNKTDLFSRSISGAERLPNGNTLICSGEEGRVFEVTAAGVTVWDYLNPYLEHNGADDGPGQPGGPGGPPPGGRPPMPPGMPPGPPPGAGPGGGPGGFPGGGPMSGLFRATRLALNHPGVQHLLEAIAAK